MNDRRPGGDDPAPETFMSGSSDERLTTPNSDETPLPTILARGRASCPRAVVVMSHGLFSEKDEDGRYARLSSLLNDIGLAMVRYDFRVHGEHEMPLRGVFVMGMVLDLQAASRWVHQNFPGSECWWLSSSFAGAVSLLTLQMRHAIAPARMALLNPVLDFKTTFLEPRSPMAAEVFSTGNWSRALRIGRLEVGPMIALGPEFRVDLMLLHPILALWSPVPPTRIVHGTADLTVPHDVTKTWPHCPQPSTSGRWAMPVPPSLNRRTRPPRSLSRSIGARSTGPPARTVAGDTRSIDPERGRS